MKKTRVVQLLLLIFVMAVSLQAQEGTRVPAGLVVYATGSGFQVAGEAGQREYDLSVDAVEGMELFPGDFVNTYDGTFVEVRLEGERHTIKISENTSFRFSPSLGEKEKKFAVSFGRVRARVGKLAGLEQFAIQGPSGVAGVRGTDFGYDVLFRNPEEPPEASIYCFEGRIEVTPTVRISESSGIDGEVEAQLLSGEGASLLVDAGEMVVLRETGTSETGDTGASEGGFVLQKSTVPKEISEFWRENDFQEEKTLQGPREPEIKVLKESPAAPPVFTKAKFLKASALTAGLGTVFGLATATFLYAEPLVGDMDPDMRDNLALSMGVAGGIFFSTSLFTLLAALF